MNNQNELTNLKKSLDDFLSKKRQKELGSDREVLIKELVYEVSKIFKPILDSLAQNSKMSKDELKEIAEEIANKINLPEINIPDLIMPAFPKITVPEPRVTVNVPPVKVPDVIMPDEMNVKGWVSLMGVDLNNPLPVQLRDAKGNPVNLFDNLTQIVSSGGGGKQDYFTIKGFSQSAYSEFTNADNRLRVSVETGGSGLTDAELRALSVPVEQVSGSSWSTYISGSSGSISAAIVDSSGIQYSGSNPVPANLATALDYTIDSISTYQVSGGNFSVYVTGSNGTLAASIVDSDGIAYSGSNPVPVTLIAGATSTTAGTILNGDGTYRDTFPVSGSVAVSGITGSISATILNGEGLARDSWLVSGVTNSVGVSLLGSDGLAFGTSKPVPVTMVAGVSGTTGTANVDSSGIQYSGSNPLPVYLVLGAGNSSISVGAVVSDVADDGSAPNKTGGIARTSNPTAVAAGDIVTFSADDLGRQLVRPVQVRDLISTAYVSKTTGSTFGTETTLFAGATSTYHDLIYVLASNDSTVAIGFDIRGTLAGNVLMHLEVPANSTTGLSLPVPLPAGDVGASWTIDLPDVTGTNVYVSALFSKEI